MPSILWEDKALAHLKGTSTYRLKLVTFKHAGQIFRYGELNLEEWRLSVVGVIIHAQLVT